MTRVYTHRLEPHEIKAILDGRKTTIRIPVTGNMDGDFPKRQRRGVGDLLAIPVAHLQNKDRMYLRITSSRVERLHLITEEQAVTEGYSNKAEFQAALDRRYKHETSPYEWRFNPYMFVLGFCTSLYSRKTRDFLRSIAKKH